MKYTAEQEFELKQLYETALSDADRKVVVTALSEKYRVSKQSIIGKLSSMGIYQKPKPLTKTGEPVQPKETFVAAIRILVGARDHELESLEKASKRDLQILTEKLVSLSDQVGRVTASR